MFSLGVPESRACLTQGLIEHTSPGSVVIPGMEQAEDEESLQGCVIKLAADLGDRLLNSARPSTERYITHFRILCQKIKRGTFIHGPPYPTRQRFTTDCLISHVSLWVLVYTKTSTKEPLDGGEMQEKPRVRHCQIVTV